MIKAVGIKFFLYDKDCKCTCFSVHNLHKGILCKTFQHKSFPWVTARQHWHIILPLYSKEHLALNFSIIQQGKNCCFMPCSAQPSMTYAYIHTYRRTRVTSSLKVWMVLQRYRTQARRHREATPEGDEHLDVQRRRTEARRHRETTPVREIRQEEDRVCYHASRDIEHSAPLFGQPAVHQMKRASHSAMAAT